VREREWLAGHGRPVFRPQGLSKGVAKIAIYHLSAKVVSRAKGQSVVASAAYRASEALHDDRYGMTQDYSRKQGVEHSEILAPEEAPAWVFDRQTLWNQVELSEKRKDSQLAREIEIGLPIELTHAENVDLVREYVKGQFVSKGMIADFSIHEDDPNNPHAHVLLTMRSITEQGFGEKDRSWNAKGELLTWRDAWASHANEHLARAGHAVRIDHRTLEAQGIELEPGKKIGVGRDRQADETLPRHVTERIAAQELIARENGEAILADPTVALHAITHQRATFTERDLAKFLHTRTSGAEQFQAAMLKVTTSNELVALGRDDFDRTRYTTRTMLEAEKSLLLRSQSMEPRRGHGVAETRQAAALAESGLSSEQRAAFEHVTGEGDLKALVGVAGSGKSTMLEAARKAWEAEGLTVKGAALSGIAAENLEMASGIKSRTLASHEWAWNEKREALTRNDVLVIDEAGMVGTKQLERILAAADKAHAKVILVGDPEQLQAIEAGAAFRGIVGQVGMTEMTEVRRQKEAWMREATQALSGGRTQEALSAYEGQGAIVATETREGAREALLEQWAKDQTAKPHVSQLIVAYTRDDVRELNREARDIRKLRQELGAGETVQTTRGEREIAANERIMFLRNEKSLGVKNGTLATVERIDHGVLQVRLDGKDETRIVVDTRDYQDLDYGYASTIHKSQGSTVDRTYVLASRYFDRHTSYVALSRHRDSAMLFWGREEFLVRAGQGGQIDATEAKRNFEAVLSRARPKELAHDYLEGGWASPPLNDAIAKRLARSAEVEQGARFKNVPAAEEKPSLEELQRRARENWLALKAQDPDQYLSIEEQQRQARERWREYQQSKGAEGERSQETEQDKGRTEEREKPSDRGIDDDLSL
jgi:Ti-type conjugative transfer relaxase TraA